MKQLLVFMKKEWLEQMRTGRLWILLLIFTVFGISAPALAKLTPLLFELMADAMQEQGITVQAVEVTALTSWQQYYKNSSLVLIVFVILSSGVLTTEYQSGSLIPILTKGVSRPKILSAKALVQLLVWSICHWLSFGITLGYTVFFWDNSLAKHWLLAGALTYLLGIWLLVLVFFWSAFANSNMTVLLLTGLTFVSSYFLGLFPKLEVWLPSKLASAGNLLNEALKPQDFTRAVWITLATAVVFWCGAIRKFNKKNF